MGETTLGKDGKRRCQWCSDSPDYVSYHDTEWGFPTKDDIQLFEKICLESFQSGLSWRTILTKRDNFRQAFSNFDFNKIAEYKEKKVQKLLIDSGIVRHRGKIEATINNAKRAKELVSEFGSLANYFWSFKPLESIALAKDLKKRGWKFVGPTTVYAFMQASGLINDHAKECFVRDGITK